MNLSPKTLPAFGRASLSQKAATICAELPDFDRRDFDSVRSAFSNSTTFALRQAWLDAEQADFAPGLVRVGWRNHSLLLFAELTDADICTWSPGPNRHFWELGELFEIFLRPAGQDGYSELHVTPKNQQLHLRYENAEHAENVRKLAAFGEAQVRDVSFHSQTWVKPGNDQWFVFAEIPAASVCKKSRPLAGLQWHFSFSRYDYTRGRQEPVISSTSAHRKPDFHRQQEWHVMTFAASLVNETVKHRPISESAVCGK